MVNNMNISYDHYKIFYYVTKYGSITRAANALTLNQPNITRTIKTLEAELECTLFERTNKGVRLTPEGERLYEHIRTAVEQIQAGEEEVSLNKSLQNGIISIGATEVALRCFLLPVLGAYHSKYPSVKLKICNYSTPQAITALQKGLVDLAVVTTPADEIGSLNALKICSFRETAICGHVFEHLAEKEVSIKEIAKYPLIALSTGTKTYEYYRDFFSENGLPFEPDIEAETADLILPMVQNGLGIGFVPEPFLDGNADNICRLKIKENMPTRYICLIKNNEYALSIASRELERSIRDKCRTMSMKG